MDDLTKRLLNEPYRWREHEVGATLVAVCPVCGSLAFERFVHADWHKSQTAWVDWSAESGTLRLDSLTFLAAVAVAVVPVSLVAVFVASLAGAVAGVA